MVTAEVSLHLLVLQDGKGKGTYKWAAARAAPPLYTTVETGDPRLICLSNRVNDPLGEEWNEVIEPLAAPQASSTQYMTLFKASLVNHED